ncbi:hypothetical protein TL16_g07771 [Triparma laevis f. inornata]|uniref:Uncharacterized protein n=1 Tax=Triparma laevis f. inornata TaxID=1714386 RepID=A0A9W7EEK9_9STRA|nr:hypothetical protein TL16_g07771 [Triparma laevis f. inornata]
MPLLLLLLLLLPLISPFYLPPPLLRHTTNLYSQPATRLVQRTCKIGDFVTFSGDYADEIILGEVTRITTITGPTPKYELSVLPLEPTDPIGYYTYTSRASSLSIDITKVFYTPSSKVRNIGIKIPMNQTIPLTYKDECMKYKLDDWVPQKPKFNNTIVEIDAEAYKQVKFDLILDALKIGIPAFLFIGVTDLKSSFDYALGLIGGIGYLSLLTLKTDGLGDANFWGKLKTGASKARYLALGAPIFYLAIKSYFNGKGLGFDLLEPKEFGYTVAGGLTYRLSLIGRQVRRHF